MRQHLEELYKKKGYLSWFLKRYLLKEEKTRPILDFLLHNDEVLTGITFVEDIRPYPNAILISSEDAKTVSYLLRIEGKYYENVDEFMEILKTKQSSQFYIWLAFNREFICSVCSRVIKDPKFTNRSRAKELVYELEKEILLLQKAKETKKKEILLAIDEALANKNKEMFFSLSNLLKDLL